MNPSAPARAAASRTSRSGASGVAEPDVVGDRAAQQRRMLGHPGDLPPPGVESGSRPRSTPPTLMRPPVGREHAEQQRGDACSCPAPLSPTSATVSPGRSSRSSPSSTGPERAGYENDTRSKRTGARAGLGASRGPPGHGGRRRVEQREHPLGHGQPVRAGVVLRAQPAERQVQLGREDDHGQPGLEPEAAVHEPHARRHRDERDPQRGGQLEHRPRQEADAQRLHRRRPVALADARATTAACSSARPKARSVGRPRTTSRKCVERRRSAYQRSRVRCLGVAADEPHEHRHERQREQHDQRRLQIHERDPADHQQRDDRGQHGLRQVAREVRLQRLDALRPRRRRSRRPSAPSTAVGCARRRRSTSASRSSDSTLHAARRPATSIPHANPPRSANASASRPNSAPSARSGAPSNARATIRASSVAWSSTAHAVASAERRVDRQQRPRRPRAAAAGAGRARASGLAGAVAGSPSGEADRGCPPQPPRGRRGRSSPGRAARAG